MPERLSRRKLSMYAADRIEKGETSQVLAELAAYLIESKRTREAEMVVRAIEDELSNRGIVIATVTSAHPRGDDLNEILRKLIGADKLYIQKTVDPTLLGGIRIDMPGRRIDATLRRKLTKLRSGTR